MVPGYVRNSSVTPSDLDRLVSGYRLIQTALLGDPSLKLHNTAVRVARALLFSHTRRLFAFFLFPLPCEGVRRKRKTHGSGQLLSIDRIEAGTIGRSSRPHTRKLCTLDALAKLLRRSSRVPHVLSIKIKENRKKEKLALESTSKYERLWTSLTFGVDLLLVKHGHNNSAPQQYVPPRSLCLRRGGVREVMW